MGRSQPGFLVSKETKTTSFSSYLLKRGQKIVQWTKKYQTKEVSLTPRHELSFFQNLEIPDGALVMKSRIEKSSSPTKKALRKTRSLLTRLQIHRNSLESIL